MFQLFSSVTWDYCSFLSPFSPQWSVIYWDPLCSILFLISLYADFMTILIFSYRMTAFNQSFWSSQLNSQLTSRRFHLGVPQTPLVSTPPHWTLVFPTFLTSANSIPIQSGSQFIFYTIPYFIPHQTDHEVHPALSSLYLMIPSLPICSLKRGSIIPVDLEYCLSLIKSLQQFLRAFRNHGWLTTCQLAPTSVSSFNSMQPTTPNSSHSLIP